MTWNAVTETPNGAEPTTYVMDDKLNNTAAGNDVIDLAELLTDLWRQKWLIAICMALGLAVGVYKLNRATFYYTAELKVTPAQQSEGSTPRLGGLASLASRAGIGLGPASSSTPFLLYTEGVSSRSVADALAQRPDIMHVIFADEWDERTQRYVEPRRGLISSTLRPVKSLLGFPPEEWRKPDAARLQDYIKNGVKVLEDPESPVVTLQYLHPNPKFAATFLTEVHRVLDSSLRRRARDRATQYINYLAGQLQVARLAEHRSAIAQTLAEQERNRMMASSTLAYAAEPLDQVVTSLRPTQPRPALVLAISLLVGLIAGIGIALVWAQMDKHRGRRSRLAAASPSA